MRALKTLLCLVGLVLYAAACVLDIGIIGVAFAATMSPAWQWQPTLWLWSLGIGFALPLSALWQAMDVLVYGLRED